MLAHMLNVNINLITKILKALCTLHQELARKLISREPSNGDGAKKGIPRMNQDGKDSGTSVPDLRGPIWMSLPERREGRVKYLQPDE
jgi:hypothetical protein